MIRWTVAKAMMAGISVIIFAQLLYVAVLLKIADYELLRLILLGFPCLAAFVAAYWSPCRKISVGVSMAMYGAVIGVLSASCYDYFALPVDRIGGLFTTFFILLVYYGALSIVGSVAGVLLSRRVNH